MRSTASVPASEPMQQLPNLDHDTRLTASPRHLSCGLSEEAVILNLDNGLYYGLNESGSHVWELLKAGTTFGSLVDALFDRFDSPRAIIEGDLRTLLADLQQQGLIQIELND
jgi:hypothetical protein